MMLLAHGTRGMTVEAPARLPTGIQGLDDILGDGLIPSRLYLVAGAPGSGKTTLALQLPFIPTAPRSLHRGGITAAQTTKENQFGT
jgi:archaellum biogenesis ATPase FlaH